MAFRSTDAAPVVEVGSSTGDQPSWRRIGVIAAIGFVVGVAWPRLAGVRLGPSPPEGALSSAPTAPTDSAQPLERPADPTSPTAPPAIATALVAPLVAAAAPSAMPAAAAGNQSTPPAGALRSAEVEWEVALVRDEPKTGKIVARLPRGTSIRVGPAKDGWYPVKYGSGFASEGWVYRGAIGR